jgi:hypothetical protein
MWNPWWTISKWECNEARGIMYLIVAMSALCNSHILFDFLNCQMLLNNEQWLTDWTGWYHIKCPTISTLPFGASFPRRVLNGGMRRLDVLQWYCHQLKGRSSFPTTPWSCGSPTLSPHYICQRTLPICWRVAIGRRSCDGWGGGTLVTANLTSNKCLS